MEVLYEDNHLLVVNKPAGLPTMGVTADRASLLERARQYLKEKYAKPGKVYLGVVSRLDAPVSGVVLIARTSKAAARLTKAFQTRQVEKTYLALVAGEPDPPAGRAEHFLRKDERHRRMHTTSEHTPGAQYATLTYRMVDRWREHALLEVKLETGRKHQIRVQLAKLGCPILGDRKYGSSLTFPQGIALHSWRLAVEHPVRREPLVITAPLPAAWPTLRFLENQG